MPETRKNRQTLTRKAALLCVPEKNGTVEEAFLDSGDLILCYQAVYRPFFLKVKKLFNHGSGRTFTKKIQLDALGAHVWSLLDGEKNVSSIIKDFSREHCLDSKEAEVSVTRFLRSLGEKGLIGMRQP